MYRVPVHHIDNPAFIGITTMSGVGHTRLMKAVHNLGMTREPGRLALECLMSAEGGGGISTSNTLVISNTIPPY